MSDSREDSPDWLRSFQAPSYSALTLSSDSELSPNDSSSSRERNCTETPTLHKISPKEEEDQDVVVSKSEAQPSSRKTSKRKASKKPLKVEGQRPNKKKKIDDNNRIEGNESNVIHAEEETSEKHNASNFPILSLSSDSESLPASSPKSEVHHEISSAFQKSQFPQKGEVKDAVLIDIGGKISPRKALKPKSSKNQLKEDGNVPIKEEIINSTMMQKGNDGDVENAEAETSGKHVEAYVSSSRLPLVLSDKVHRTKALVECEGDTIDMSGDMGAVGRVVISDTPSGNNELLLDLKGTMYRTTIVPSRTFCVVSFGQSEAKIEAIMDDFIQLKPLSNVYEAETMVEGTVDGFSFDSEDEAEKMPKPNTNKTDDIEGAEEQTTRKAKGKAEKSSGVMRRKGKTVGGKQPVKKIRKKSQAPKRGKAKK